jgi:hypothetical protein
VCDRFFRLRHGAAEIQKWLESEGFRGIKRPRIYPLLSRGVQSGYVQLCAPFERRLEQELATTYPQAAADISVVNVRYGDLRASSDDANVVDLLAVAGARKAPHVDPSCGCSECNTEFKRGFGLATRRVWFVLG